MNKTLAWFGLVGSIASMTIAPVQAAPYTPETDCVIQNFAAEYYVQLDASLQIAETITYDCGSVPGKHGIFRVLPTRQSQALKPNRTYRDAPITLESITDTSGRSYEHTTSSTSDTLTWKIGDPDRTISGINTFILTYSVRNALAYDQSGNTDGFVWNLVGQFWNLPINSSTSKVHFPAGITEQNTQVQLFSGVDGSTDNNRGAVSRWLDSHTLEVTTRNPLAAKEGVTLRALFPAGIITQYTPSFWDLYGRYAGILMFPLLVGIYGWMWSRFGRDPKVPKTIVPSFTPPGGLRPAQLKALEGSSSDYLTPTIIDLAVRGFITIEKSEKKAALDMGIFKIGGGSEITFTRTALPEDQLQPFEKKVLETLFSTGLSDAKQMLRQVKGLPTVPTGVVTSITLTQLTKNLTYNQSSLLAVTGLLDKDQVEQGLVDATSKTWQVIGFILIVGVGVVVGLLNATGWLGASALYFNGACIAALPFALVLTGLISRRTQKGAELMQELKGFQLFMQKAETYRQQFNEQEGIFDKLLPYAIAFGLTTQWINAMKVVYGAEATNYQVPWLIGAHNSVADLTMVDSLAADISAIAASISSSVASSGSSGGSSSGGGGGGGGGGSW